MGTILETKKNVKARKKHQCQLCLSKIEVGEYYSSCTVASEGQVVTLRYHPECEKYAENKKVFDAAYNYGYNTCEYFEEEVVDDFVCLFPDYGERLTTKEKLDKILKYEE